METDYPWSATSFTNDQLAQNQELPIGNQELPMGNQELAMGNQELPVGKHRFHPWAACAQMATHWQLLQLPIGCC